MFMESHTEIIDKKEYEIITYFHENGTTCKKQQLWEDIKLENE